jgi:hypothetical protein
VIKYNGANRHEVALGIVATPSEHCVGVEQEPTTLRMGTRSVIIRVYKERPRRTAITL